MGPCGWDGFVPAVKAVREDAGKKAEGPFRTYAQVIEALRALVASAKSEMRAELELAGNDEEEEEDEREELEEFFSQMERWIWEKWEEHGLPLPMVSSGGGGGAGGAMSELSPTRRSSRPTVGVKGSRGSGSVGGGGGGGTKRVRYAEDDVDDDDSLDNFDPYGLENF